MSNNKLFSDPIISTDNDLDKDYTLDNNGSDLDPNKESLYDLNDNTEETNTSVENKESTDNNVDIKDSDIFTTEPLSSQEVKRANQVTNNYAHKMDQTYNDTVNEYEDEPESMSNSSRNWIIFGAIALIILICGGWFVYSMFHKEDTQPKQPVTNVVVNPTPDTQNPNNQDQQTPPADNSNSNDNNSSDNYYPDDNYNSGGGGGSYTPDYGTNNGSGSSNTSTDNTSGNDSSSTDEAPPKEETPESTDNGDTPSQDQSTDSQTSSDSQTDTDNQTANSEGTTSNETASTEDTNIEAVQNSNPSEY